MRKQIILGFHTNLATRNFNRRKGLKGQNNNVAQKTVFLTPKTDSAQPSREDLRKDTAGGGNYTKNNTHTYILYIFRMLDDPSSSLQS